MAENKPRRFLESRGSIQNDPVTGTPLPKAPDPAIDAKEPNVGHGVAAATKKGWARLVTALLALPVIFIGYDVLANAFL